MECEVTRDVIVAESEFVAAQRERRQMTAPNDIFGSRIIEQVLYSHVVFGENQFLRARVPDGQRPIADELSEALRAPLFECCRDDGDIGANIRRIAANLA